MSIDKMLNELNEKQREAVTHSGSHALVLAGAGCGKTKTIISRAAYLISEGVDPKRIQILTFTKRSASEIVSRVENFMGEESKGLQASTFHTWCLSIIKKSGNAFNVKDFTIIDRDDQLQLFKLYKNKNDDKENGAVLLKPAKICDLYSYSRNTRSKVETVLEEQVPESIYYHEAIIELMKRYELQKKARRFLDYDDILDIVARGMKEHSEICKMIGKQYDHVLVDEMQDTNPLQWELLEPLTTYVKLFCVGDDAQSIYGFRGADFKNVHSFSERIQNSTILRLEDNYRSTQEILDLSNWLLSKSSISYDKKLNSIRGIGITPQLVNFENEWDESKWISEDLIQRRTEGRSWNKHMILVRSSNAARCVEKSFLERGIPYVVIGGRKLLEAAHIKDLLSILRVLGNFRDDIGWMRFLTLIPGIGDRKATRIISKVMLCSNMEEVLQVLKDDHDCPSDVVSKLIRLREVYDDVPKLIGIAVVLMNEYLEKKYKNSEWEKRKRDFVYIIRLSQKHSSILEFMEEYLLNPIFESEIDKKMNEDVVTIITIHSAKGTEREVCYVLNVSPGSFPSSHSTGYIDKVEEERRVLYVALTRAKDELIITRHDNTNWSHADPSSDPEIETYFFNDLSDNLVRDRVLSYQKINTQVRVPYSRHKIRYGLF